MCWEGVLFHKFQESGGFYSMHYDKLLGFDHEGSQAFDLSASFVNYVQMSRFLYFPNFIFE